MREIKFRAWNFPLKEMINDYINSYAFEDYGFYNQDVFAPMQYTGLKDKNGKEIYEGDIIIAYDYINFGNIKSVVKWIDYKCGFFPQEQEINKFGGYYLSYWDQIQDIEIIGNIYENPELI